MLRYMTTHRFGSTVNRCYTAISSTLSMAACVRTYGYVLPAFLFVLHARKCQLSTAWIDSIGQKNYHCTTVTVWKTRKTFCRTRSLSNATFSSWSRNVHPVQNLLLCTKFHENRMIFIARQHSDARYWYSKLLCLSVCLSLRYVPVLHENGLTYSHTFISIR